MKYIDINTQTELHLLNTKDLARLFQVTELSIRRYIKDGILEATKVGGKYYVKKESIERMFQHEKATN